MTTRGRHIKRMGLALAGLVLLTLGSVRGQAIPQPMSPPRLVNDFARLFSPRQQQMLEDTLRAFETLASTQIAVVTVADLGEYPVAEYATRLFEQWGVGTRKHDNGVLLLLKPRNDSGPGEVFIAVGYGLEGALPDIAAGRIIDDKVMPYLSAPAPRYYDAAVAGTAAIRAAVRDEYATEPKKQVTGEKKREPEFGITDIIANAIALWLIIMLFDVFKSGGPKGPGRGRGISREFSTILHLLSCLLGGGRGGGFGGGAGPGGFGGGRTGGGGAGRKF